VTFVSQPGSLSSLRVVRINNRNAAANTVLVIMISIKIETKKTDSVKYYQFYIKILIDYSSQLISSSQHRHQHLG
jgi:hypothetical protein